MGDDGSKSSPACEILHLLPGTFSRRHILCAHPPQDSLLYIQHSYTVYVSLGVKSRGILASRWQWREDNIGIDSTPGFFSVYAPDRREHARYLGICASYW